MATETKNNTVTMWCFVAFGSPAGMLSLPGCGVFQVDATPLTEVPDAFVVGDFPMTVMYEGTQIFRTRLDAILGLLREKERLLGIAQGNVRCLNDDIEVIKQALQVNESGKKDGR